jgi:ribonuclease E
MNKTLGDVLLAGLAKDPENVGRIVAAAITQAEASSAATNVPEAHARPDAKAEPQPDARAAPQPETKAEPKPEAKAQPDPKAELKPDAEAKTPPDSTPKTAE